MSNTKYRSEQIEIAKDLIEAVIYSVNFSEYVAIGLCADFAENTFNKSFEEYYRELDEKSVFEFALNPIKCEVREFAKDIDAVLSDAQRAHILEKARQGLKKLIRMNVAEIEESEFFKREIGANA